MKEYIKGTYIRNIFKSDNGYIIGIFRIKDTNIESMNDYINKTITFTGYFHELTENDNYYFYGEGVIHPKYGFQFQVEGYERVKPEDKDGIIEFLSSDLFPGVGVVTAESIVNTLGNSAIDKIINDYTCLYNVPKVSKKLAKIIYENLVSYEESHKTIVTLCDMGFSMRDALNIYNYYGSNTLNYVEHNIYNIIDDIKNISFVKVDKIARNFYNISATDENRIKAAIIYLMRNIIFSTGDCYLEYDLIKLELEKFLNICVNDDLLNVYLSDLEMELKIVTEDGNYYLFELYEAENNVAEMIKYLANKTLDKYSYSNLDKKIKSLEKKFDIKYDEIQKLAITKALENNISIITGGPGTGKTTIIKGIVELFKAHNKIKKEKLFEKVALLAPTGRASKRISEATGFPAMTIHRFLKWNKDADKFAVNEFNKASHKLIIVDEFSMVDILLLDNLFKGLNNDIKLVLVGDFHQLPSVGPGQILKDLVNSGKVETIELKNLYRQSEESYIPILAKEIKEGNLSNELFLNYSDYQFIKCYSNNIIDHLKNLLNILINEGYNYTDFQVMAPVYYGINGIDNLNKELQKILNPPSKQLEEYAYGNVVFRVNDKVIQLVNVPDENVFNGDIGIIIDIIKSNVSNSGKTEIYVDFDGKVMKYFAQDLNQLRHAYAISIHKAQGSEFPIVIMPMCPSYRRMLYRKLIYTGVTRAKNKLFIVGDPNAYTFAIQNINEYMRKSQLLDKIMNNF